MDFSTSYRLAIVGGFNIVRRNKLHVFSLEQHSTVVGFPSLFKPVQVILCAKSVIGI